MSAYLKDPDAIYRNSLAIIKSEVDLEQLPENLRPIAIRLVHSSGMTDLVRDLAWQGDPAGAGRAALADGAPILVDATMVAAGITRRRLPAGSRVLCTLEDTRVPGLAEELRTTRSAAAVELWRDELEGAVVAIGNAPTALFRLLEILADADAGRPAAIFAFPVGFVGAAESKQALLDAGLTIPYLTLEGRRGGSAMAAAAVNALTVEGEI